MSLPPDTHQTTAWLGREFFGVESDVSDRARLFIYWIPPQMRRRPTRPLIDNGDGSLSIQLTRGMRAVIDAADAELASECNWQAFVCDRNPTPYAVGHPARRQKVYLHRWLLGLPPGSVDHIDGNGLNNRRCNLRVCSARENSMNLRRTRGEAVFKGVTFNQGAFRARIVVGGRSVFLGRFPTAIEAALAYDAAAVKHFGEFAATNESLGLLESFRLKSAS